ncbi:MAG: transporter ATP-binding protein [Hyphomicrobiales bacterium]|nr:transporter ATP-binding protein [Hyphomicrobiales bacterium]
MKDVSHAGVPDSLDVAIQRKAFESSSGARIEVMADLRFRIESAQTVAIMGPSGCGKSTLLRMIAGLDADYEGGIVREGQGRTGFVFQEPTLLAWRTVEQNIRLVMQRPDDQDALLEGILERMELMAHRRHFPGELSVGLARRVAIGRALAALPGLLLLDEPFASLDAPLIARLQAQLKAELALRPTTTILVTHRFEDALSIASRVLVFSARPSHVLADIALGPDVQADPARADAIRREIEHVIGQP